MSVVETLQEVISCAAKLGLPGLQLAPLANDADGDSGTGRNGASAGAEADADIMAAQLREQLASRLRAAPQQGPPEAWACIEVCTRYSRGRQWQRIIWGNRMMQSTCCFQLSRFLEANEPNRDPGAEAEPDFSASPSGSQQVPAVGCGAAGRAASRDAAAGAARIRGRPNAGAGGYGCRALSSYLFDPRQAAVHQ